MVSCSGPKPVKPERKAITEAVYASGYIVPKDEYKLYALSDGYIIAKYKHDGDSIKKGEAIFKVQNDAFSARLSAASTTYDLAKRNSNESSPILMDLKNKVRSAEAKNRNDSINLVRYKNMFAANAVTKTQYDQAELSYEVSTNDLKSTREQYQKTLDQLQVDLKNAQSAMTSSGSDLANYTITSMMDGELYATSKELGEAVRKNDQVAIIGDKGHKLLQLSVDQQDIEKVKTGLPVIVKMDITGGKVYKAKVSKIYPEMNQSDQSFKVEAEFDENYDFNFTHASVEANIIIGHKDNALLIPVAAVRGEDEVEVKALGSNKKVKIKKGMETLEYVEVLEGLSETDEVVLPQQK
ncbi:MAG: efflux transporter family, subunit [Bacteroidota bacterium]|nr:efflux transporter family, subunit [Bacteroidota bacterium]